MRRRRRVHHRQPVINYYSPYSGQRQRYKPWKIALLCGFLALALLFTTLEILIGVRGKTHLAGNPQVMVVFGCKVNKWGPSILLQDRLETALHYLKDHPETVVVVSGGKGSDEPYSEAQAMRDYLTQHGFEGTVFLEDRSRNTWQNVNYTLSLLEGAGYPTDRNVVIVSNWFHLFRIDMLWNRAGGGKLASVLAAPVSHAPSAVKMFFREPFAVIKSFLLDR